MMLSLCILSLFALRVAAGCDRRAALAFAFRKSLKKKFQNS
jgi:hypothetical protein